ncbi:CPBP family intramembrane metalloprotease [Alkaliphilus pronyensis]|uniref:CPBP family intramembrane metalloprotease n=1 Tax=Alkaliphilus pronyensis TaxID=1482732 RepID=A0A6I0FA56_9FIRM|nr:CPBP family intramembrane metalloprotease [Alkaliphilus pronyensis]
MQGLAILAITYLTFMLILNYKVFHFISRYNKGFSNKLKKYNTYIWLGIILVITIINLSSLNIRPPKRTLTLLEMLFILLALIPFMIESGYKPQKNLKEMINFCFVFPIGEELLFRGIILSLATYLVGSSGIYVPIPIIKGVSLQVFLSAICFGITHFQYFRFKYDNTIIKKVLFAFVFGLFAGIVVEITESILYAVMFHIIANSGAAIYYIISNNNK